MIPDLKTSLPGPQARALLDLSRQYEPGCMSSQVPCVWARAEGAVIEDVDGNRFLDFSSGVLVTNVGHSHPEHVARVQQQAAALMNCYDFLSEPRVRLAERLVGLTPPNLDRAFILTTGSEAVEAALKVARRYTGRHEVLTFHGAFHGRTYGTMSVGGKRGVKQGFGPLMPGILHAPFPDYYRPPGEGMSPDQVDDYCLRQLDEVMDTVSTGDLAAVITETYQGAAGSRIPSPRFMSELNRWCCESDALLIIDEVQASFGRTGKWFGFEHYDIEPNIVVLGKGLSCGVPCSALVAESRLLDALEPGSLSSTNGGNPLSCTAALASIDIIEKENLVSNAAEVGAMLLRGFNKLQAECPALGDVRGQGLAIGLELVTNPITKAPAAELARAVVQQCFLRGLVMISPIGMHGNVIRVSPPLVLSRELAERGLAIFADALAAACKETEVRK